jgi:hypothetical protein
VYLPFAAKVELARPASVAAIAILFSNIIFSSLLF